MYIPSATLVSVPAEVIANHMVWPFPKEQCQEVPLFSLSAIDRPVMEAAHGLAERITVLTLLSLTSKTLHKNCKKVKDRLIKELNKKLSDLQKSAAGAITFRSCVESGWYLRALRIFYFFNPQALKNEILKSESVTLPPGLDLSRVTMRKSAGSTGGTILHNAVYSPREIKALCPSFAAFILMLNERYQLGLLTVADQKGKTATELAKATPVKKKWDKAERQANFDKTNLKRQLIAQCNPSAGAPPLLTGKPRHRFSSIHITMGELPGSH